MKTATKSFMVGSKCWALAIVYRPACVLKSASPRSAGNLHGVTMRKLIVLAALGLAVGAAPAFAQKNSQQEVMKSCNVAAQGKKGDDRKSFMKTCLSDGKAKQQSKMAACNSQSKGKKGDERKAFMSQCLSNPA